MVTLEYNRGFFMAEVMNHLGITIFAAAKFILDFWKKESIITTRLTLGWVFLKCCLVITLLGFTSDAFGNEHDSHDEHKMHSSHHEEEMNWVFGVKGVQLNTFSNHGENASGAGVGVLIERSVIPRWLEIELSTSTVFIDDHTIIPMDLLLKKPFHFTENFSPYLAVGPTIAFNVTKKKTEIGIGAAFIVGTYIWFSQYIGLDVEVDYAILEENGLVHELTFAAGPLLRF